MFINAKSQKFVFLTSALFIALFFLSSFGYSAERVGRNDHNLEIIQNLKCDSEKPLRFVVLGDTRSNMKIFSEIIELTNSLKPDFIIHVGDIIEKGEKTEYIKILPYFDRFESPLLVVPGNHEISKSTKTLKNFENYFGAREMSFELCGLRFILADNSGGYLSKTQLSAIEKNLKSDKIRMIFMHSPPNPPWPKHTFKNGAKELVNIIKTTGCEYAFFGHVHGYDHRMIGEKCHGYITGGGGAELSGGGFAKEIYHVLLVTVDKGKIEVKMVPLK